LFSLMRITPGSRPGPSLPDLLTRLASSLSFSPKMQPVSTVACASMQWRHRRVRVQAERGGSLLLVVLVPVPSVLPGAGIIPQAAAGGGSWCILPRDRQLELFAGRHVQRLRSLIGPPGPWHAHRLQSHNGRNTRGPGPPQRDRWYGLGDQPLLLLQAPPQPEV